MRFIYTNPNPKGAHVGDCAVRAIAIANDLDWDTAYLILSDYGFRMKNMPNADSMGRYAEDDRYPERYR